MILVVICGQIMRVLHGIGMVLLGTLALGHAVVTGSKVMATDPANAQSELRGRDVLVAGADAIATGKSPAHITIDLGGAPLLPNAKLELLLSPIAFSPTEAFLIVVSASTASEEKRLGTVSFQSAASRYGPGVLFRLVAATRRIARSRHQQRRSFNCSCCPGGQS